MSLVEVRQIGHVAVTPVVETLSVNGRTQSKALVTVISNALEGPGREGPGEGNRHCVDPVG